MATISGGDKLKARLAELSKKLDKKATLGVGFLEGGQEADGTSLPMVAAIQEFGAPAASIPPRPFMRPTVAHHSSEWGDMLAAALPAANYDVEQVLNALGMQITGEIQDAIVAVDSPELSKITLMLRKMRSEDQSLVVTGATVGEAARRVAAGEEVGSVNTKALVDSGTMLRGVSHEVST
jgi:hypothetical protein